MNFRAILALVVAFGAATTVFCQSVPGFTDPEGYITARLGLSGTEMAVASDGRFAIATDSFGGGAFITVFDRFGPGRTAIATFAAPADATFRFIGGIAWKDADTLVFSENGDMDTVYSAVISSGVVTNLAPTGSLPGVGQLAFRPTDGTLFAVSTGMSSSAGTGALALVANGGAQILRSNLGNGYAGGIAFAENDDLFVGDSNDPQFLGNAGQVFRMNADTGDILETFSLANGGGSGLYDIAADHEGDLFVTTGRTITRIAASTREVMPFGVFDGPFPFPTAIEFTGGAFEPYLGTGALIVNAGFTSTGDLMDIRPVPEPSTVGALTVSLALALRRIARSRRHV